MMRYRAATPEEKNAILLASDEWAVLQEEMPLGLGESLWRDVPFPEKLDPGAKKGEECDEIDDTHRMVDVMLAWKRCESIQVRSAGTGSDWLDCHNPVWDWLSNEYRVKPAGMEETKEKPMELWVNVYKDMDCTYRNKEAAERTLVEEGVTTLFRQVMDEE